MLSLTFSSLMAMTDLTHIINVSTMTMFNDPYERENVDVLIPLF